MKQATLKAAGTAALGVAIAAVAAGTASAAAAGGLGLPTTLANPEVAGAATGAATGAVTKVPGGGEVTEAVGTLGVANPLNPAPAAKQAPAAQAPAASAPAAQAPAAQPAAAELPAVEPAVDAPMADGMRSAGADRVGGLESVPGGQGLSKTPVGGVVNTVSGLGRAVGCGVRSRLLGEHHPQRQVEQELRAGQQARQQGDDPDGPGGETEPLGEPGADAGDDAVVAGAGEAAAHDGLRGVRPGAGLSGGHVPILRAPAAPDVSPDADPGPSTLPGSGRPGIRGFSGADPYPRPEPQPPAGPGAGRPCQAP